MMQLVFKESVNTFVHKANQYTEVPCRRYDIPPSHIKLTSGQPVLI